MRSDFDGKRCIRKFILQQKKLPYVTFNDIEGFL